MTYRDNSKLSDELGQAIRRPPTGLYELSPSLQRPHTELRQHQPPRIGGVLRAIDTTGSGWKVVTPLLVVSVMVLMGIGLMILSLEILAKAGQDLRSRKQALSWFAPTASPDHTDSSPQVVAPSVGEPA
jgi:hypothetical protein